MSGPRPSDRVAHRRSDVHGTAAATQVLDGPFAGDQAGPWTLVHFDDGLTCWCPDSQLQVLL